MDRDSVGSPKAAAAVGVRGETTSTRLPSVPTAPKHVTLPSGRNSERLQSVGDVKLPGSRNSERVKAVTNVALPYHNAPAHVTMPDPKRLSDRHRALEQSHQANFGGEHHHGPPAHPVALTALGYGVLCVAGITLLGLFGSIGESLAAHRIPLFGATGLAILLAIAALVATAGKHKGGKTQAWLALLMGLGVAGALAVAGYMS